MAFLGGAECSTAGNPLTQFTKHVQNDNTLQRDRLVGRGPGGLEEGMRSRLATNGSDQVCCHVTVAHSQLKASDERFPTVSTWASTVRHGANAKGTFVVPFSDTADTIPWLGSRI